MTMAKTTTRTGRRGAAVVVLLAALATGAAWAGAGGAGDAVGGAADGGGEADVPFLGGFLEETRIVYPLRVGEWNAIGEHLYDEPALGASVRYQAGDRMDRWIDVYFYPVGVVPGSHLDQAARATLEEIAMGIGRPGGYLEVDAGELKRFQVEPGGEAPAIPARSADLRLRREQGEYHSAMALLIDRLYYVKARYSVDAAAMERAAVRTALEEFLSALVGGTYIGSTGRCWTPAAIEALPPDAEAPAEARMSVESGGAAGAWLVGDRVLAREPDGDAAQALALLAMAMDGRLYPGCIGPDPHNPDVPEGRREIRLEYRAPGDGRHGPGSRLLPARSALG